MRATRSRVPFHVQLLAGAVLAITAFLPAAAHALACGDVVTQSVVLTSNLTCGPGDGLIAGADGITIDLKGYTIAGPSTGQLNTGAGIRIPPNRTGVEIRNGTIRGFSVGVVLDSNAGNTVRNLTLSGHVRGVDVANADQNVIEKNRITGSALDAVRLGGDSHGNHVVQNTLSGNVFGIAAADDAFSNRIAQNVVSGNQNWGIAAFSNARGNLITQNLVSGTAQSGIVVFRTAIDTIVSRNQSWNNGADGIHVQGETETTAAPAGTLLLQNVVYGNGDDGIDVDAPDTTITQNRATGNADLGIEAVPGVTDGGGNQATGNGNGLQCTNVVCSG